MVVKNNVDILDKSTTETSKTGEPSKINVYIVDNTLTPNFKANQASATSIPA